MPDKASSCGGALYAECSSRSGSGGHGQRRGRVAAQCRLSAPNADGKQKRHCAIKLNANGRLDNLLSAICRSSPLEADGYLIRREGTDYNMPTQRSMELGLFEIKETSITHADGHVTVNKTPKVTGKGQQFFINMFLG